MQEVIQKRKDEALLKMQEEAAKRAAEDRKTSRRRLGNTSRLSALVSSSRRSQIESIFSSEALPGVIPGGQSNVGLPGAPGRPLSRQSSMNAAGIQEEGSPVVSKSNSASTSNK